MIEGFFFAFVGVGIWAENDCEWDVFVGAWRFSDSYGEGIIFFIQMYFFSNVVCFEGVEGVGWVDGGVDIKTRVVFEEIYDKDDFAFTLAKEFGINLVQIIDGKMNIFM